MTNPRIVASVEARMGSSRFPGKMLTNIYGKPTIERVVERLEKCQNLDATILATSTSKEDDALADWAADYGLACYRGSEDDVLDRVLNAQRAMQSNIVVEICGDCPLIEPQIIDLAVETFLANDCDLVTTVLQRTFPKGMDVEVFDYATLETMAACIDDPEVREHVSLAFYQNPERYRLFGLTAPTSWHAPDVRCVLDYPEDLEFIQTIYSKLKNKNCDLFTIDDILNLIQQEPSLLSINSMHEAKHP